MLSSILNSDRAIQVNIRIMKIYTKMKEMLLTHKDVLLKMEHIEKKVLSQDEDIKLIFKYLKELLEEPEKPRPKIGFKQARKSEA